MKADVPDSVKKFVAEQVFKYSSSGYRIVLHPSDRIRNGSMVYTGEATPEKLEMAIGGDWRNWLGIMVHETCHLDQHMESSESFSLAESSLAVLTSWLEGSDNAAAPVGHFSTVMENESDCESRSVKKIAEYSLPVDLVDYVRRANVYLGSYAVSMRHRVWIPQPYRHDSLCLLAEPDRILSAEEIFSGAGRLPQDSDYLRLVG